MIHYSGGRLETDLILVHQGFPCLLDYILFHLSDELRLDLGEHLLYPMYDLSSYALASRLGHKRRDQSGSGKFGVHPKDASDMHLRLGAYILHLRHSHLQVLL